MIKKAKHSDQTKCSLCLSPRDDMYVNWQCGHQFCSACLDRRNLLQSSVVRCFIPSCNAQIISDDVQIYITEQNYKDALHTKTLHEEIEMMEQIIREREQERLAELASFNPMIDNMVNFMKTPQKQVQIKTFDLVEEKPSGSRECAICLSSEPDHVAIPCGHIAVCGNCLKKMKSKRRCIICQSRAQGFYKVHY